MISVILTAWLLNVTKWSMCIEIISAINILYADQKYVYKFLLKTRPYNFQKGIGSDELATIVVSLLYFF